MEDHLFITSGWVDVELSDQHNEAIWQETARTFDDLDHLPSLVDVDKMYLSL